MLRESVFRSATEKGDKYMPLRVSCKGSSCQWDL